MREMIAEVLSVSNPSAKPHHVSRTDDGEWECGCIGWTRHVPRRDCRHISMVRNLIERGVPSNQVRLTQAGHNLLSESAGTSRLAIGIDGRVVRDDFRGGDNAFKIADYVKPDYGIEPERREARRRAARILAMPRMIPRTAREIPVAKPAPKTGRFANLDLDGFDEDEGEKK